MCNSNAKQYISKNSNQPYAIYFSSKKLNSNNQ